MTPRLTILPAIAIAAALFAAGCGGGDDEDGGGSAEVTVTTSSLSKAQFVKKATEICSDERQTIPERTAAYEKSSGKVSGADAYAKGVKKVLLPLFQSEVTKISKLGAPSGEKDSIEAMLTAQQEGIDEVEDLPRFQSSDDVAAQFTEATKLLRAYDLTVCAVIPEPSPST